MVEKPKRAGSPVMGCRHWRPASASISARSSPLGGGAANSCPITEKRRCAHRSWTRGPRACWITPALPPDQGAQTVDRGLDCRRRASSADRGRPLSSVPVASGDRGDEAQQRNEPLPATAGEALDQRGRQAILIDRRHEYGPADLPERARREGAAPPLSPALDRPAVDANQLGQLSHPRGGRALPHDRDQHYYRGEIDLAPEEPERRRRSACAATVAGAAEAEAPIMLLAEPGRTATRLAAILGRMQHAAAQRASSPPRRNRDVLIKDEKQLMECGVGQQG